MNRVVPIQSLVGLPTSAIAMYGDKAAWLVKLHEAQLVSPVPFSIPPHWAVPAPSSRVGVSTQDIRHAYDALTQGMTEESVLMVRSSAYSEEPGQNPTKSVRYNPLSPRTSWKLFAAAFDEVYSASPDMGALLTRMVGTTTILRDGTRAFGYRNVSFVADSHSAIRPEEMHLAVVNGLGSQAVEGDAPIEIAVDRQSGEIVQIVNATDEEMLISGATQSPPMHWDEYRQGLVDFFDLREGRIISRRMGEELCRALTHYGWILQPKNLVTKADPEEKITRDCIGRIPFGRGIQASQLISALQFLAERFGPVQIEGAYPDLMSAVLHFYQLLPLPGLVRTATPLSLSTRDISSTEVMGHGTFRGPMVMMIHDSWYLEDLKAFDASPCRRRLHPPRRKAQSTRVQGLPTLHPALVAHRREFIQTRHHSDTATHRPRPDGRAFPRHGCSGGGEDKRISPHRRHLDPRREKA